MPARGSPQLFAACYVLRRLLVPRHPPNALIALTRPMHRNHPYLTIQTAPSMNASEQVTLLNASDRSRQKLLNIQPGDKPQIIWVRPTHSSQHAQKRTNRFTLTKINTRVPSAPPLSQNMPREVRSLTPPQQILSTPSLNLTFPGGDGRVRTDDPLLAKQVLSQLSYAPLGNG